MYEYQGGQDLTRMHRDNVEKPEIQRRFNELFNLADSNFVRSDNRMHTYKLGRPTPKVKLTKLVMFVNHQSLPLSSFHHYLTDQRYSPSISVCITGPRHGAPSGGRPAGGQRCSVLPTHQQQRRGQTTNTDHRLQGHRKETDGQRAIPSRGGAGRIGTRNLHWTRLGFGGQTPKHR